MKRAPPAALAALLLAAALLRMGGLDHDVRRGSPAGDETHNFVSSIHRMWSLPTADPTVRPGYPGFFNVLAFLPVGLGHRLAGDGGAYVGGRALCAAFGVLNVLLVFLLARSLAGPWAGVSAAALLAFNRGEIVHAHAITPDLVVITGIFGVLLLVRPSPPCARRLAWAGALCGLTVAVKSTGLVVLPALAVALLVHRVPPRRAAAALLAAAAAFAVAAPYALAGASEAGMGLAAAVRDYYSPTGYAAAAAVGADGRAAPSAALGALDILQNLGPVGVGLALAAVVLFRPRLDLLPSLAALAAALAAVVPAQIAYPRHVLVPSALLAVLAACGLRALHGRLPVTHPHVRSTVVAAVAVLALVPLVRTAVPLAARFREAGPLDEAATWIETNVPGEPLVATGYPRFVLDRRFEVRHWAPPVETALADVPTAVWRHYDLVVGPAALLEALRAQGAPWARLQRFEGRAGATAVAFPDPVSGVPVIPSTVSASEAAEDAAAPWDGRSAWRSASPTGSLSGEWTSPRRILRVDLVSDDAGGFTPQGVILEGRHPDGRWRRVPVWQLRPRTLSGQNPRLPRGQVYVPDPPPELVGLRIVGRGDTAWGLRRIAVYAEPTNGERAGPLLRTWPRHR